MKTKQKQNKLVWALSIVLVALLAFTSVITFAYFTDSDNAQSADVKFGALQVTVEGGMTLNNDSQAVSVNTRIVPGCTITVNPGSKIDVSTNINSFVRIQLSLTSEDAAFTEDDYILTYTGADWSAGGDGYFYWKDVVSAPTGEADLALNGFEFAIKTSNGNELQNVAIKAEINVEAIQADHIVLNETAVVDDMTGFEIGEAFDNEGKTLTVAQVAAAFTTVGTIADDGQAVA